MSRSLRVGDRADGPRLSIVVPTLADTTALEETLVSVLENRPADCEVVVPLACDYADPWGIADEVRLVPTPASTLAACINHGLDVCRADFVHVLAAGWRATPDWTDGAVSALASGAAAVASLELAADDGGVVAAAGIAVSRGGRRTTLGRGLAADAVAASRIVPSAPTLGAGFWRRETLLQAGGFSDRCGDERADADMAAVLAAAGGPVVVDARARVVQGRPARAACGFVAGRQAERLFWRSWAARPTLGGLVAHAAEIVRDAAVSAPLGTLPMLVGRIAAACEFGSCRARSAALRDIAAAAAGIPAGMGDGGLETGLADGRTLRIDAAEAVLTGPRRRRDQLPLRRSA